MQAAERPDDQPEAPLSISQPSRDELNLAEFPIALLTDRVPSGQKTLEFQDEIYDQKRKQVVVRKLTVTGSDKFGLPTAKDDEVILGLIHLTKQANNFTDRKMKFRRSDLIKLLRWPDTGQSYRRIAKSLSCWLGVTLYYENSWWDKQSGTWITKGFHIIEGFEIADAQAGSHGQMSLLPSEVTWNETIFRSFQSGYLKSLDFNLYLEFQYPTSQRMYRFLDKHFYRSSKLEYDLKTFACEHIGLSRNHTSAKLKEKIQPALDELEEVGFLEPMSREERYKKTGYGEWRIRLQRKIVTRAEAKREQEAHKADAAELIARGVTPATADELVASFPGERIRHHLEVFDWLEKAKDRRISKSPAGYLVESIRDDYAAPKGFESAADQTKRTAAEEAKRKKAADAKLRAEAEEKAREQAEAARIQGYLDALSPEAREQLEKEALEKANPFFFGRYRDTKTEPETRAKYLKLIVETHVSGILDAKEAAH
jgi:hypothetical protein